jgi:glyceraldehyde 3-phosphate dehydrogenase
MIDLTFHTKQEISAKKINHVVNKEVYAKYKGIAETVTEPMVSIDFNHTTASAIFDLTETRVVDKMLCRVVAWYDNEWAFSCRMLEMANLMAKL